MSRIKIHIISERLKMPENSMKVSFMLPVKIINKIKKLSEKEGISFSDQARMLLKAALNQETHY